jgi:glycosyltransferase involved in cell wall biosynthesis
MKILIAAPLYPPELGGSSAYVKELAGRLVKNHKVKIILYGHLPEKSPGVSFVCVEKNKPLFIRLFKFSFALWRELKWADLAYFENGASVELPFFLLSFLTRKKFIFHIGDKAAEKKIKENKILKYINDLILRRADFVLKDSPLQRPEILPFKEYPKIQMQEYEKSWDNHIKNLEDIFENAKRK